VTAHVSTPKELLEQFVSKAEALGASVRSVGSERDVVDLLRAEVEGARPTASALRTCPGLAADAGGPSNTAEVVAAGAFAVAETGSVAVVEANEDRGACMLAERLWLLVPASEILPTLDQALERIAVRARLGAPYVTLMSGPSRTADIERVLTVGVHGPRALSIVLIGTEKP
jgi:L-lactate dehydrogenase complex protein LldG